MTLLRRRAVCFAASGGHTEGTWRDDRGDYATTGGSQPTLIEKQKISFDLLSDPGNAYVAKLGLRFTLPDDLKAVYLGFGNDLAVRNGEGSWTLPMPGRFVVDRGGIVRAADVDPDYERRPEPQQTIDEVKALA